MMLRLFQLLQFLQLREWVDQAKLHCILPFVLETKCQPSNHFESIADLVSHWKGQGRFPFSCALFCPRNESKKEFHEDESCGQTHSQGDYCLVEAGMGVGRHQIFEGVLEIVEQQRHLTHQFYKEGFQHSPNNFKIMENKVQYHLRSMKVPQEVQQFGQNKVI
jgi:hypothetical protein